MEVWNTPHMKNKFGVVTSPNYIINFHIIKILVSLPICLATSNEHNWNPGTILSYFDPKITKIGQVEPEVLRIKVYEYLIS
jgi:hypothetical protein